MTDLISRLRALSRHEHDDLTIGDEAADEIERLTKQLEATQSNLCSLQCFFEDWKVAHSTVKKDVEIEKLRASLGAIHCRVCHGASTHGMGEAIASECEHAVPELKSVRAALKETP